MTNRIALIIAFLLVGFFALDYFLLGWGTPQIIMRRLIQLIEYVAFWR